MEMSLQSICKTLIVHFHQYFKPGQALHITANPSTVVNVIGIGMVHHECVGVAQFPINRLQYFPTILHVTLGVCVCVFCLKHDNATLWGNHSELE